MAITNIAYQDIATPLAITSADALGNGSWCSSALVDNNVAGKKFLDALVGGSLQVGAVTVAGTIDIYIAASWDGVEFTAGVDNGDGGITWGTTGNTHVAGEKDLFLAASISVDATDDNNDIVLGPISVAQVCGGVMPLEWCVVVENNTGIALHATGTNNHLEHTGIEYETA